MIFRFCLGIILFASFFSLALEAKSADPYKVLGVDRKASQREIQKAFHKLSLQYHPDKNKNKGAQEKFAEINNAYEILSDEEKRKNYDLYGDETGRPSFDAGPGGHGGYTHFTGGHQGNSHFNFRPDEWQRTGHQGNSKSFSFSFGNPSASGSSFNFGFDDIFSNFFGGATKGWNNFGGFGSSTGSQSGSRTSPYSIQAINSKSFKNEIIDKGVTWLLLSYGPSSKGYNVLQSIVEEVGRSLEGAIKVGSINCQDEKSLCKEFGLSPSNSARVFVYSYRASDKGSLIEYGGEWEAKSLKTFCQNQLPRFSKRVDLGRFDFSSSTENLPRVLLLSTKKDTPVIWRALSGLYRKRFIFYDAEVNGVSDPSVKRLGVDALPAVVGWLSNGEKQIVKTGITVKNLKSAVDELSVLLDNFEKKNKKAASSRGTRGQETESEGKKQLPLLTASNLDTLCGERTPVCIIGVFRSSKGREKLESILSSVSQKSLTRRQNQMSSSGVSVSYSLLDANKQAAFLNSFDKYGFKSTDKLLVAYKPRKGKFAAFTNEMTMEEVERFISSVLNGDVQFSKTRQKPVLK
ncbi:DnaJ domain [Macleaya cordata]|uniref:DnaJ domain n=1 Tax=Macleaya cordata TaxID=56857 RepID=A0A200PWZ7_MACCD|nr:DnaJ domain [Macleaya cordata]